MQFDPPTIIGVAGGSGSGKTTLTRAVVSALPSCPVIDHDAYYRDLSHLEPAARSAVNFDHPASLESELLCQHLDALRDGRTIAKPRYDFSRHVRQRSTESVAPAPVILVEGILVLAVEELASRCDLRIYIDTPPDLRLLRRIQRDTVERGRTFEDVAKQYLHTVRPMHERFVEPSRQRADLILPDSGDFRAVVRFLVDAVQNRQAGNHLLAGLSSVTDDAASR